MAAAGASLVHTQCSTLNIHGLRNASGVVEAPFERPSCLIRTLF